MRAEATVCEARSTTRGGAAGMASELTHTRGRRSDSVIGGSEKESGHVLSFQNVIGSSATSEFIRKCACSHHCSMRIYCIVCTL